MIEPDLDDGGFDFEDPEEAPDPNVTLNCEYYRAWRMRAWNLTLVSPAIRKLFDQWCGPTTWEAFKEQGICTSNEFDYWECEIGRLHNFAVYLDRLLDDRILNEVYPERSMSQAEIDLPDDWEEPELHHMTAKLTEYPPGWPHRYANPSTGWRAVVEVSEEELSWAETLLARLN